jgi:hypothetical protein
MSDIAKLESAHLAASFTTVFCLVMDRSGSMRRFGDTPEKAINDHISTLQKSPGAASAMGFVVEFAEDIQTPIPPQPLPQMPALEGYSPTGRATRLYGTALAALKQLLELEAKTQALGGKVNLILTIFTDGQDNASSDEEQQELKELCGLALEKGLDLQVIGIGTSGQAVARAMGFPPKCAVTIAPEATAIRHTMVGVTQRAYTTITGFGAPVPSTPVPPSSH